jgi:hypothetical protein
MNLKLDIARVGSNSRRIPHNMSNMRMHYMAKSRWTKEWKRLVEEAFLEQATLPRPRYDKSTVVVKFYAIRQFDRDGAYHAAKPVIDGLTNSGIIVDDSQDHIDLEVRQIKVKHREEERVEIEITEL